MSDGVDSCKEFVWRIVSSLIELGESCKEFVRRIVRGPIE